MAVKPQSALMVFSGNYSIQANSAKYRSKEIGGFNAVEDIASVLAQGSGIAFNGGENIAAIRAPEAA